MTERQGTVVESTGSHYRVKESSGEVTECRIRGRLRLSGVRTTNPVAVGDRVVFETEQNGDANITAIEPRSNYIIRRSSNLSKESHIIAANIDRALLVATLFCPEVNTEFIDRFLVTCEAYHIPVTIVLNKCDLIDDPATIEAFEAIYRPAGYRVVAVSATEGEGMEELKSMMNEGTTLVAGNSGVGKSTIIGLLVPDEPIRTGAISTSHHKGRHTTTFARLYTTASGSGIIDTPGIKGFGLIDIERTELWHYFPEMMRIGAGCRYYNCTHVHEPDCAVCKAVESGEISYERYVSYLKMMEDDGKYR